MPLLLSGTMVRRVMLLTIKSGGRSSLYSASPTTKLTGATGIGPPQMGQAIPIKVARTLLYEGPLQAMEHYQTRRIPITGP
jgi:hypothetical protein